MQKTQATKLDGLLLVLLTVASGGFIWIAGQISWTAQMYRAVHAGMLYMVPAMGIAFVALGSIISALYVLLRYGRDSVQAMVEFVERHRVAVLVSLAAGYWFLLQVFLG